MNKNKIIILLVTVLLANMLLAPGATANDCSGLIFNKFYFVTFGSSIFDGEGATAKNDKSIIKIVPFPAKCVNCYGGRKVKDKIPVQTFSLEENCGSVSFNFPVTADFPFLDDNFMTLPSQRLTLNFICQGSLATNRKITANCNFSDNVKYTSFIPAGTVLQGMTITESGSYTFDYPLNETGTLNARPIKSSQVPSKLKKP